MPLTKRSKTSGNSTKNGASKRNMLSRTSASRNLLNRRKPLVKISSGMLRKLLPKSLAARIQGGVNKNIFVTEAPDKSYNSIFWKDNKGTKMFITLGPKKGQETSENILKDLEQISQNKDQDALLTKNLPSSIIIDAEKGNVKNAKELAKKVVDDFNIKNEQDSQFQIDKIEETKQRNGSVILTFSIANAVLSLKSDHGKARKLAGGIAKLAVGNFISAGVSTKKATDIGKAKDQIPQIVHNEQQLSDLLSMANSLKGSLKRQAVYESTIGIIKQGISLGASALTGTPGISNLVEKGVSEVGAEVSTKVASKVVSTAGSVPTGTAVELISPQKWFQRRGGKKLSQIEWTNLLTKYLVNEKDEGIKNVVKDLVSSLSLNQKKGDQLLRISELAPSEGAKLIVARQISANAFKKAVKKYRKQAQGQLAILNSLDGLEEL